jgi:hypothetical protein
MRSSLARLSALSIAFSVFSRIMPPWFLNSAPMTRSKLKYGIGAPCKVSNPAKSNLSLAGSPITTLFLTSDCSRLLRFGTATARSRAHCSTHLADIVVVSASVCFGRTASIKRSLLKVCFRLTSDVALFLRASEFGTASLSDVWIRAIHTCRTAVEPSRSSRDPH